MGIYDPILVQKLVSRLGLSCGIGGFERLLYKKLETLSSIGGGGLERGPGLFGERDF
jgi:hypothetical protein